MRPAHAKLGEDVRDVKDKKYVEEWDYSAPWYHGSPFRLTKLRKGSTITQQINLARVFSHKPTMVSIRDGELKHNGKKPGFLYTVCERLGPEDVTPHPRSSMDWGMEWVTKRSLVVSLMGPTEIRDSELLTEEEIAELQARLGRTGQSV